MHFFMLENVQAHVRHVCAPWKTILPKDLMAEVKAPVMSYGEKCAENCSSDDYAHHPKTLVKSWST